MFQQVILVVATLATLVCMYKLVTVIQKERREKADKRQRQDQQDALECYVPMRLLKTLWNYYRDESGRITLNGEERNLLAHLYGYDQLERTIKVITVGECVFFMRDESRVGMYPVAHIARFEECHLVDIRQAPGWWHEVEKYKVPTTYGCLVEQ